MRTALLMVAVLLFGQGCFWRIGRVGRALRNAGAQELRCNKTEYYDLPDGTYELRGCGKKTICTIYNEDTDNIRCGAANNERPRPCQETLSAYDL